VTDDRAERVSEAARHARGAIEALLDALGFPANERALSLAIDRIRQLEEGGR
jgi:hypothetical protein